MEQKLIDKIVEMVHELAPIPDIAFMLDMTEAELRDIIDDPEKPEYMIFRKAVAETISMIRKKDIELYNAGSPTAAAAVALHLQTMIKSI